MQHIIIIYPIEIFAHIKYIRPNIYLIWAKQHEPAFNHAPVISERYVVGRYISLKSKIAKNKGLYYDSLEECQKGWHEGNEDISPFIKYLLSTILAACRDFEERISLISFKLPAVEMVRRTAYGKIGKFTKNDIMELCPSIGKTSIENALKKLVEDGALNRHGKGKSTFFTRSDTE